MKQQPSQAVCNEQEQWNKVISGMCIASYKLILRPFQVTDFNKWVWIHDQPNKPRKKKVTWEKSSRIRLKLPTRRAKHRVCPK